MSTPSLLSDYEYIDDLRHIAERPLPWERLRGKTLLISGASGMIGSCLADTVMYRNRTFGDGCRVIAVARNEQRAMERFAEYADSPLFSIAARDINEPFDSTDRADFVIHAASNTHPLAYSADPVGTVMTNVIGTDNLLKYAAACGAERFLFASSVEVYGENRGDIDAFDEGYCGYIDCNTLRAGYPESKRAGEALCQAYIKQEGLDCVIARLARTYGPTMLMSDSKAVAQFIKNALSEQDIVLKSEGRQFYSYHYAADAVSGLLTILLSGDCGQAYNIADSRSDIALRDLAALAADWAGTKVIFELPDQREAAGYSAATRAVMSADKLRGLGWAARMDIGSGVRRTLGILSRVNQSK